jgi:hypothetical protein
MLAQNLGKAALYSYWNLLVRLSKSRQLLYCICVFPYTLASLASLHYHALSGGRVATVSTLSTTRVRECATRSPFDISLRATYNLVLDAWYCRVNTRLLTEDPMLLLRQRFFQLERTVKWTFEFW